MKKLFVTLTILLMISGYAYSQAYQSGVGFRGGLSNGLTFKYFIDSDIALEGLLTARYNGFNATALYQFYIEPFTVPDLYFYYGLGGHFGTWQGRSVNNWWKDKNYHSVIGIDGIAGVEYNIPNIPFSVSMDYKPGINIIGYPKFWGDEFAISFRYVWGRR
jgi:hypothetical protein